MPLWPSDRKSPEYKAVQKAYKQSLRQNDPYFRMVCNLRRHLQRFPKKNSDRISKVFGCSPNFFRDHLQQTAIDNGYKNFDINNYDVKKYHKDHIIPCSKFDLNDNDQKRKCFHWSNIQILTAEENMSKGSK
jgi:hypothetical protein